MLKSLVLGAALAGGVVGFAGAANAAEGCGPGWWRGPGGFCHPMATNRACPVGWHLGPAGRRCWPNQGYERACPPGFHLGPEGRRCRLN
ncbi:MAG TPA: hypothetical protein VKC66_08580 [Xanthobacteraceae bacterium]|nr:hypothetical protein [Xanthobacteraceae bacterium]